MALLVLVVNVQGCLVEFLELMTDSSEGRLFLAVGDVQKRVVQLIPQSGVPVPKMKRKLVQNEDDDDDDGHGH